MAQAISIWRGLNRKFLVLTARVSFARREMKKDHRRKPLPSAILLYADTQQSADLLYFGGFRAPDPFIALRVGRRKVAVLNALEYGRGLKESAFDEILPLEAWVERSKRRFQIEDPGIAAVIATLLRHFKVRSVLVPTDFPSGVAFRLLELGVGVEPAPGPLFPEREIKSETEARAIAEGNRASARGLAAAESLLRRAVVKRGRLVVDGQALTSERVREEIEIACLRAGAVSLDTIVAGGDQACDPHCAGSGVLRANQLIIVDVFPRVVATGYHGDMTRTFLRGSPSDAQARLVAAVRSAQQVALGSIRAGLTGRKIHDHVMTRFEALGYETKSGPEGSTGFFHGTGHGLGLAVHEPPRVNRTGPRLRKGTVVTVEPGLYYPGLGGCRIEDVVQVTTTKPRLLSKYHYDWVL